MNVYSFCKWWKASFFTNTAKTLHYDNVLKKLHISRCKIKSDTLLCSNECKKAFFRMFLSWRCRCTCASWTGVREAFLFERGLQRPGRQQNCGMCITITNMWYNILLFVICFSAQFVLLVSVFSILIYIGNLFCYWCTRRAGVYSQAATEHLSLNRLAYTYMWT